jgi:hypothetical protein
MNPARLPKIAPGQLPPPNSKDDKSLPLQSGSGFLPPFSSPKKPKLNIAGIEESDSEGSTDDEMIIVEDTPPIIKNPNTTIDNDTSMIIEEEKPTNIQQGQKRKSDELDKEDPFDFNETDSSIASKAKRVKPEFSLLRHKQLNSKVKSELSAVKKTPQPKYRPTWNDKKDDDEEEEGEEEEIRSLSQEYKSSSNSTTTKQSTSFTRQTSAPSLAASSSRPKSSNPSSFVDQRSLKRVSQAQACLKSGEQEDFTQDFDYFMTVMEKEGTTENTIFLRFVKYIYFNYYSNNLVYNQ